jgi:hypothetical protein
VSSWTEAARAGPFKNNAFQLIPGADSIRSLSWIAPEACGWVQKEYINGYLIMLPVDPFNVAACGEPGGYTDRWAAGYGVLPDRARVLLEIELVGPR